MNRPIYNVQHQVQTAFTNDRDLRDYEIDVLDNNGIITLRGVVPTRDARERAEAVARDMDGLVSVINELDVV